MAADDDASGSPEAVPNPRRITAAFDLSAVMDALISDGGTVDPRRIEAAIASQLETVDAAHAAQVDSLAANVGDLKA